MIIIFLSPMLETFVTNSTLFTMSVNTSILKVYITWYTNSIPYGEHEVNLNLRDQSKWLIFLYMQKGEY